MTIWFRQHRAVLGKHSLRVCLCKHEKLDIVIDEGRSYILLQRTSRPAVDYGKQPFRRRSIVSRSRLTRSRYFFALSLTLAPQMTGILEDADPTGGLYDPAGIDMMTDADKY
jgi:hypothetical protein